MRQKKDKFKRQEHRTFIDWFIAVPARITNSEHQIKLKMYEHHFYKPTGRSLTGSSKRHKKKEGGKNKKINPRVYGRGTFY